MQIDSHINGFDNFECVQVDDGYRAVIIRYAIPAGVGYIEFVAHNHHFFRLVADHTGILDSQCGSVNTCYIPQSGVGIYFDRACIRTDVCIFIFKDDITAIRYGNLRDVFCCFYIPQFLYDSRVPFRIDILMIDTGFVIKVIKGSLVASHISFIE